MTEDTKIAATDDAKYIESNRDGQRSPEGSRLSAEYKGPWRNRGYTFYIQMCYRDELTGQWAKLRALLDKHQLAFDDYWLYYYPKKKQPEDRPTAARRPLWQELDERFGVSNKSLGYSAGTRSHTLTRDKQ